MRNLPRPPVAWFALGIGLLLATTALLYAPGLYGPFMFDDFANLPALGAQGPIDNAAALARYLTSGNADPTGRPLSTASFLLDARDWPASPYPFKRDNVILHLLNGGLLALVLRELGYALRIDSRRALIAALFGAAAWTLHPLFVSTVLYVVQREAMLPATFCLLAMLTWLQGRTLIAHGGTAGAPRTTFVLVFFAAAALSKPNGLLCPALLLLTEAILFDVESEGDRRARRWTWMLTIPGTIVVVTGLLLIGIREISHGVNLVRGWSVAQRLLTEPSILVEYLCQLALVMPSPSSVFHDQYQAARTFFDPWFTLPAIVICLALIVAACRNRRLAPAASIAVLFFFVGHAMESTAIPLELYFEHRNYLPAMLLFWPIGLAITTPHARLVRGIAGGAGVAFVLVLALLARENILLWADPARQAVYWASVQPDSPRAVAYAAQVEAANGHLDKAIPRIESAARQFPLEPQVAFNLVDLHCEAGAILPTDADIVTTALQHAPRDPGALLSQWMSRAIQSAASHTCEGLNVNLTRQWINAAGMNPRMSALPGRRQDIAHLSGVAALATGDALGAAAHFRQALREDPKPQVALSEAALLGAAGAPSLGLAHLEYFETLPVPPRPSIASGMAWVRDRMDSPKGYWTNEMNDLRIQLKRNATPAH